MPPPGMRRPDWAAYTELTEFLEAEIDRKAKVNPGTKVLHRLNRTEYSNVVRDLLDLEIDAATLLPPDDSSRGFDNIAGSLTISSTLLESYAAAAGKMGYRTKRKPEQPTSRAAAASQQRVSWPGAEGLYFCCTKVSPCKRQEQLSQFWQCCSPLPSSPRKP